MNEHGTGLSGNTDVVDVDVATEMTWICDRADGSRFTITQPTSTATVFSFEDPHDDDYAPEDDPPDVIVYCKGVRRIA